MNIRNGIITWLFSIALIWWGLSGGPGLVGVLGGIILGAWVMVWLLYLAVRARRGY